MRMKLEQIIKQMEILDKTYDPVAPTAIGEACRALKQYKLLKEQYENRLKADLVAVLTELKLTIRETHVISCGEDCKNCDLSVCIEPKDVIIDLTLIQQKINELKEAADVKDDSKQ